MTFALVEVVKNTKSAVCINLLAFIYNLFDYNLIIRCRYEKNIFFAIYPMRGYDVSEC